MGPGPMGCGSSQCGQKCRGGAGKGKMTCRMGGSRRPGMGPMGCAPGMGMMGPGPMGCGSGQCGQKCRGGQGGPRGANVERREKKPGRRPDLERHEMKLRERAQHIERLAEELERRSRELDRRAERLERMERDRPEKE